MRLLLDTHTVLWWLMDDPDLSPGCSNRNRRSDENDGEYVGNLRTDY